MEIEAALREYNPKELSGIKLNQFRDRFYAFEVPVENGTTKGGLIDFVRVDEYFGNDVTLHRCMCWDNPAFWERYADEEVCGELFQELPALGECPHTFCRLNHEVKKGTPSVLFTAVEIKVTKADFKSAHGHNFAGNLNYYAVPKELYPQVADLVPDGIGVLLYSEGRLRKVKNSEYRSMSVEKEKWMLLSVTKRLRKLHLEEMRESKRKLNEPVDWF